jgi:hypothetical protein
MEGTTMEGIIPSLYQGQYVVNNPSFSLGLEKSILIDFSNMFDAQKSIMNLELFKHFMMFHYKYATIEIVNIQLNIFEYIS